MDGNLPQGIIAAPVDQGKAVERISEAAIDGAEQFFAVHRHDHFSITVSGPLYNHLVIEW